MTVTIKFDDDKTYDFPMEAIAEQLTKSGFSKGAARLKDLPSQQFEECFKRFIGDELNFWNESKQQKAGKIGFIV